MKRIRILMLIITLVILSFIAVPSYASEYGCEIKLYCNGKTSLTQGEEVELDISIENITINEGIALYNGMLEYNSDEVEVEVVGNGDWELYHQKDNNITLSKKDLENSQENAIIGKVILKAKTDIEINNIIKLTKNEVTNGEICSSINDSVLIGVKYSNSDITKEDVTVTITSSTDLNSLEGWTLSEDKKSLTKKYESNKEEEVTIVDAEGIQTKINISVLNIDKASPVITGVEENGVYDKAVNVSVTDDNLESIELIKDGTKVEGYTNGAEIREEGQYEIKATDKAGNTTTVTFKIEYPESFEMNLGEYLEKAEEGEEYLINILPGTTKTMLLNNIDTNGEILIYKGEELVSDTDASIGTGMKLKILFNNEEVKEYTIVVTGDLNGDGLMGDIDLLRMARYIVGLDQNIEREYLIASDIYKDDVYADGRDLLRMARILVGLDNF